MLEICKTLKDLTNKVFALIKMEDLNLSMFKMTEGINV